MKGLQMDTLTNLVPVENQLLSGAESEQQNNLVDEYEEIIEQDN